MPANAHVFQRLTGIQSQLMAVHLYRSALPGAGKGRDRQEFIDRFLAEVLAPPFRFGTGEVTDTQGNKSGELDIVVEHPFGPSLPMVGGTTSRLYLAETVTAAIVVKADVGSQWDEVISTAQRLRPLGRSFSGKPTPKDGPRHIPLFVAGYKGWSDSATLEEKLAAAPEVDGVLIVTPGIFVAAATFGGIRATGPWALWGLVACIHRAAAFLTAAKTELLEYGP